MMLLRRYLIIRKRYKEVMENINISPSELQLVKPIANGSSGQVYHGIYRGILDLTLLLNSIYNLFFKYNNIM